MGLCGDIKTTLEALLPLLQAKSDKSFLNDQLLGYSKVIKDLNAYVENKGSDNKIHPEYVMAMVDETAQANAIFTVDTGMTCVWGTRYLKASGQRKMLGSFNHGTMANAMPQAIGASFAYPGRQVIALCGDGGISMLLGDLATIAQYKLPVKIIVFNNRSLGMVKLEMEVAGLPDNETDMQNPDFAPGGSSDGYKELYRQPSGRCTPGIGRSLELTGSCSTECNDRSECTGYAPANRMESNDRIRTSHV